MQQRPLINKKHQRIQSIALRNKYSLSRSECMLPVDKTPKASKSMHESSIKLKPKLHTMPNNRQSRISSAVDKMQEQLSQLIEMVKVKVDRQQYLELRLNQILRKRDDDIINLRQKLRDLQFESKSKDYEILGLKMELQRINASQYLPSKTTQPSKHSSYDNSPAKEYKPFLSKLVKSTRCEEEVELSLSPFNVKLDDE